MTLTFKWAHYQIGKYFCKLRYFERLVVLKQNYTVEKYSTLS